MTIQETASAIVALINAKPTSPTRAEIEAILADAHYDSADDPLAREWGSAVAELRDFCSGHASKRAGRDADADRIMDRGTEATLAIWKRGARSVADLALFARVARYWQWDENDPESDADFKENLIPDTIGLDQQSLAQLVNATLQVTGGIGASGPAGGAPAPSAERTQGDAACLPLLAEIRETMERQREAYAVAGKLHAGPEYNAAEAEIDKWGERLRELEDQIPNPPRSHDDILLRAVLARYGDDADDGRMPSLENGDCFRHPAARLVEAVLQWHGLDPTKVIALPGRPGA